MGRARPSRWALAAAVLAAAAAIRLAGIQWGLPHTLNADEPHFVDLAVSFGAGTLRPYSLKFPTFWPYLLFAAYLAYFAIWSGFGLRRAVSDFAVRFAWQPGPFYLIARLLAAACSLAAAALIWREESERDRDAPPWAALLLLVSPVIVELAHSAKPDCLLLLCACFGWRWALAFQRSGRTRDLWLAGLGFGGAAASHYTAAPAALTLLAAVVACRKPARWTSMGAAAAAWALGLLVASPYLALDWRRVLEGFADMRSLMAARVFSPTDMFPIVARHGWNFAGAGSIAGLAAVAGAARLWGRDRRRLVVLAAAPLAYVVLLSNYADGGWQRYQMAAFPGWALLAAEGLEWARALLGRGPLASGALAALALGPGLLLDAAMDSRMRLPDTRRAALNWLRENVDEGRTLLLDVPHASPAVAMTREEIDELARKTEKAGSPRARLYRAMAAGHPGGGYRVLRVERRPQDLASGPRHAELSQADALVVDVRPGLAPALAAGAEYAVTTDFGATRESAPDLKRYFDELETRGRLVAVFAPKPGESMGPTLRIFSLRR
jgi:hypothetical protein